MVVNTKYHIFRAKSGKIVETRRETLIIEKYF